MDECGEWADGCGTVKTSPRFKMRGNQFTKPIYNLPIHEMDGCGTMIGKNRQLVTDELAVFEKQLVELQDCRKITYRVRNL